MLAVDTNVLVYAHKQGVPLHARAKAALADLAGSSAAWAIPWACLQEFYAVVTHPRLYAPPSSRRKPWRRSKPGWLRRPCVCSPRRMIT